MKIIQRHFYIFLIFSSLLITGTFSYAAVQVNATRVIYDGGSKEASIAIKNLDQQNSNLVQSWIDTEHQGEDSGFIVIPPLFLLKANEEAVLRIKNTNNHLPQDRESIFWLSVKNIAPIDPAEKHKLTVNIRTRIKLIYRPKALTTSRDDIFEAYKKLTYVDGSEGIKMKNPTAYYINFSRVMVDGKMVHMPGYIAPFSDITFKGYHGNHVLWQVINDYGGVSDPYPGEK